MPTLPLPAQHIAVVTGRGKNDREHWRTRAKRVAAEKSATLFCMGHPRRLQPGEFAVITLTRVCKGTLDDDNLVGSLSGVRDAVATWLGVDDGNPRLKFVYDQAPGYHISTQSITSIDPKTRQRTTKNKLIYQNHVTVQVTIWRKA